VTIGDPTGTTIEYYHLADLTLKNSNDVLGVVGPVVMVVDGDVDIKGEIQISGNGSLEMYTPGDVTVGGNGVANLKTPGVPGDFLLFGTNTSSQLIKLHGNGALSAAVYAPNADVDFKGGGHSGTMFGAVVAKEIFMNGNYSFHYDEALADIFGPDASWRLAAWYEITRAADKIDFDVIHANPSSTMGNYNL